MLHTGTTDRLGRATLSLDGLSVGDALGDCFLRMDQSAREKRRLHTAPWYFTDDTVMAKAIVEELANHGHVDQDSLAAGFLRAWKEDPARGYGPGANQILREMDEGKPWRELTKSVFDGQGSFGNGAAMRAAPLGAWFSDDFAALKEQARLSAEITHSHPEGIHGAIAVALAAAWALAWRGSIGHSSDELFPFLMDELEPGSIRDGIERARNMPLEFGVETAARTLGNGIKVTALDTVPFCIWMAARHIETFEEAMWQTISAGGDIDTTCAIVGGIVVMSTGKEGIPREWLQSREDLRLKI